MQEYDKLNTIAEELISYYTEKKKLSNLNFKYISNPKYEKYFRQAAQICFDFGVNPSVYVDTVFMHLGDNKHYFSPMCLQSDKAKDLFSSNKNVNYFKPVITRVDLSYEEIWGQQKDLANRLLRTGRNLEDILLDASNKFYAWFRILITADRNQKIINEYKEIALKEMDLKLRDFITTAGLDIQRIIG